MSFHKVQRILTIDYDQILNELAKVSIEKLQIMDSRNSGRPMDLNVIVEVAMVSIGFGRQSGQTDEVIKFAIKNKYCVLGTAHTVERFRIYTRGNNDAVVSSTANNGEFVDASNLRGKKYNGIIIDNSHGIEPRKLQQQIMNLIRNKELFNDPNLFPIIKVGN